MRKHFDLQAAGEACRDNDTLLDCDVEVSIELDAETLSKYISAYGETGSGKFQAPAPGDCRPHGHHRLPKGRWEGSGKGRF